MTDIVERLRQTGSYERELLDEAAAEIERLRRINAELCRDGAEIERLRAALRSTNLHRSGGGEMTDLVQRLRHQYAAPGEREEAADEIERLRHWHDDFVVAAYTHMTDQKTEIERLRAAMQARNKYCEAEVERLGALLKRHDECWRRLHEGEYTGALRDDTRTALG